MPLFRPPDVLGLAAGGAERGRPGAPGYNSPMSIVAPSRDAVVRLWLPVLVWAGVIFWLSATPNLRVASADNVDFLVRKAGHMSAFGVLAVLLWRALAPAPWRLRGLA